MEHTFKLPGEQLFQLLRDTRERTLALVGDLTDDQLEVPKLETVNPMRWELGHVAFFYDVFLLRVLGSDRFLLPDAELLYDSFNVEHGERWTLPVPSRDDTLAYMKRVLNACSDRLGSQMPDPEVTYLYLLSVLHEDMHGEALTYTRQFLGYPAPELAEGSQQVGGGPLSSDVEVPGGSFQLGASPDAPFVFDNEKWAHPVELGPFRIARAPVTNREFAMFVEDQGYQKRECWSHQGWKWRRGTGAQRPLYWERGGSGWLRRSFDTLVPLEPYAPVAHVTWFEAEAYCRWANRRLPSEAEWEMAASCEPTPDGRGITGRKRRYPWGDEPPSPEKANLDSRELGCVDVGALAAGDSAFGCRQMAGNIWEWTSSPFYPFPGYVVDRPYKEYSAPWFGDRMVLKGGAWATRSRLAYNTYRNFFQPHRRDVFAGFRTCAL